MSEPTPVEWLMAGDPAIRWQVLRDILGAPRSAYGPERARVEHEGWGAQLLALQDPDGQWAGGAFLPADFGGAEEWEQRGQPWTATAYSLTQLREFGLAPDSPRAQRTVRLVGENCRWDHAGEPFWEGETEECINGRTLADGAYFGVDVEAIVERLLGQQMTDGGWNCERENGAVVGSFDTTINVVEGLLEHERATGGSSESRAARAAGEEYLLKRRLFRRARSGEIADPEYLTPRYPARWRYDILRALDHLRAAAQLHGGAPDPRTAEALEQLRGLRRVDGRWDSAATLRGRTWFAMDDGAGAPSRWNTLRALRVLRWAEG